MGLYRGGEGGGGLNALHADLGLRLKERISSYFGPDSRAQFSGAQDLGLGLGFAENWGFKAGKATL